MLLSIEVLKELAEVSSREKFDLYVNRKIREEFIKDLIKESLSIEVKDKVQICNDPKDDMFLELAINGHATHIISGDKDMLKIQSFHGIPILTAKQFLGTL